MGRPDRDMSHTGFLIISSQVLPFSSHQTFKRHTAAHALIGSLPPLPQRMLPEFLLTRLRAEYGSLVSPVIYPNIPVTHPAGELPNRYAGKLHVVFRMLRRVFFVIPFLAPAGAEPAPLRLRHKQRPAFIARPLPGLHVFTPSPQSRMRPYGATSSRPPRA